jgi:hypothetical protein
VGARVDLQEHRVQRGRGEERAQGDGHREGADDAEASLTALRRLGRGDRARRRAEARHEALEVYTKLRDAKLLTLELDRRGTPLTLTITIK